MKKKISIIDVIIVLVIIGAVAFVGKKAVGSGAHKGTHQTVSYTVLLSNQEIGRFAGIKPGDVVCINEENDNDRATVKAVSTEPSEIMTYNSNTGEYRMVESKEGEDIIIELESDVLSDDIGMKNGDTAIKVGMNAAVRGTGYSGKGYIIKIAD